jgi:Concanavalin A-like lectin/glucanases superfamily
VTIPLQHLCRRLPSGDASHLRLCLLILTVIMTRTVSAQTPHPLPVELAKWTFDAADHGSAFETFSRTEAKIEGVFEPMAGPVGPAILMDGYTTQIHTAPMSALARAQEFSITCWIKVDAYPWNSLPIVDQASGSESLFLGLGPEGHLLARVERKPVAGQWVSAESVPLRTWTLVTLTFDRAGKAGFFIDDAAATAGKWAEGGMATLPPLSTEDGLLIGHVRDPLLPGPPKTIHPQLPVAYSLEGSLGSVTVYGGVLGRADVQALYGRADKQLLKQTPAPPFPRAEIGPGPFGAFYTTLRFNPGWDMARRMAEDSDVVVRFPQAPIQLVFWQGNNFVPAWVTENNRWYTDEFVEVYGHPRCPDGEDCEPMSDKQSRYSHVRILESTPARVVIHWRYALSEVEKYKIADAPSPTAWGDWADEYWFVYPDGIAVRKQVLWSDAPEREKAEFQESIVLIPAGERPEDSIHYDALTFADTNGNTHTYSWQPKSAPGLSLPIGPKHFPEAVNAVIQWVNLKSEWKPFEVAWGSPVSFDAYNGEQSISAFEWWNHWPVAQIPSSGRSAVAPDRPGHTSVSHIYWPIFAQDQQRIQRILMTGLTTLPANDLVETAASWRTPAKADVDSGLPIQYDPAQRAYVLKVVQPGSLQITLHGTQASPVFHPAIVIAGWTGGAKISVKGAAAGSPEPSIGHLDALNGSRLVVFLPVAASSDVDVTVSPQ